MRKSGIMHRLIYTFLIVTMTSAAEAQQSSGLNFAPLADELLTSKKLSGKIAVYPLDMKESGLTRSAGRAIEDALRNAIQKKAGDIGLTVVARVGLTAVYNDKQFTSKTVDYAELAAKADVDAIVVVSAKRIGGDQVSITAKVYGVTGANQGNVLGASSAHAVTIQTRASVSFEGVFSAGEPKPQFDSVVVSALSNKSGLSLNKDDKTSADFLVKANIEFSISDKESADAQGLKLMSGLFSAIPTGKGGVNPLAGVAGGMKDMGKTKQISVHVVVEATDLSNQSKLASEHSEIKEVPFESTDAQLRNEVQETVRKALKVASDNLGATMVGGVPAKKAKGMLE